MKNVMNVFKHILLPGVALFAALLAAAPALAQSIGRVLVASGEVTVVRGTTSQPATAGFALQVGDRVTTGRAGNAQLWFTDTSIVALRNGSDFVVEKYSYNSSLTDNLVFNLVKGGFRTVAGLIGVQDRKAYQVKTKMATLGRRGTQYGILYCEQDCPLPQGGLAPDGLYGGVYDGRVSVANNTPEVEFGRDQYFYIASINSIPQPLLGPPAFFADRLAGLAKNAQKPASEPPASKEAAPAVEETAASAPVPPTSYTTTENRTGSGAPSVVEARPPIGVRLVYVTQTPGTFAPGGVSGFLQPANYSTAQVNGQTTLAGISGQVADLIGGGNGTFQLAVGTAGFDMLGQDAASGVRWGRWINGSRIIIPSGVQNQTPGTGIHYIYGVATTDTVLASKTGTFDFSDIGGTTPTLNDGTLATTFSFAPITVDFTNRTANMGTSTIVFPNATITVFGNPATAFILVPGRGGYLEAAIVGTCTGSICDDGTVAGFFGGMFFGANPNHIGMSLTGRLGQVSNGRVFSTVRLYGNPQPFTSPPFALLFANSLIEANGSRASYGGAVSTPGNNLTLSGSGPTQTLTAFNLPQFTYSGAVGNSGIDMAGFDSLSGVYYGRWINGSITTGSNQAPLLPAGTQVSGMGVHYMYGQPTADSVIAAKTGSAQYVDYVGTYPTASNGETANFYTMGPIDINFTTRTGVIQSVFVDFPTSQWNFSNLPFNINVTPGQGASFDANLINVGSCVGSGCGPVQGSNTARADFFGRFIGNSGNFLGVVFQGNSGGNTPSGNPNLTMGVARLFKCPTCP